MKMFDQINTINSQKDQLVKIIKKDSERNVVVIINYYQLSSTLMACLILIKNMHNPLDNVVYYYHYLAFYTLIISKLFNFQYGLLISRKKLYGKKMNMPEKLLEFCNEFHPEHQTTLCTFVGLLSNYDKPDRFSSVKRTIILTI